MLQVVAGRLQQVGSQDGFAESKGATCVLLHDCPVSRFRLVEIGSRHQPAFDPVFTVKSGKYG